MSVKPLSIRIQVENLDRFTALGWTEVANSRGTYQLNREDVLVEHDSKSPPFPCMADGCDERIDEHIFVAYGARSRACWEKSLNEESVL